MLKGRRRFGHDFDVYRFRLDDYRFRNELRLCNDCWCRFGFGHGFYGGRFGHDDGFYGRGFVDSCNRRRFVGACCPGPYRKGDGHQGRDDRCFHRETFKHPTLLSPRRVAAAAPDAPKVIVLRRGFDHRGHDDE